MEKKLILIDPKIDDVITKFNTELDLANNILLKLVKTLNWVLEQDDVFKFNFAQVLESFAKLIDVSRAYFFKFSTDETYSLIAEWKSLDITSITSSCCCSFKDKFPYCMSQLKQKKCINSSVDDLPDPDKLNLLKQNIKSLLIIPIFCSDNELYGFVGFDDCKNSRKWGQLEITALKAVSAIIGTMGMKIEQQKQQRKEINLAINNIKHIREQIDLETQKLVGVIN